MFGRTARPGSARSPVGSNPPFPPSGVTYAAKGYFDALVKMGELASESQGSKELGKSPVPEVTGVSGGSGFQARVWSVCA